MGKGGIKRVWRPKNRRTIAKVQITLFSEQVKAPLKMIAILDSGTRHLMTKTYFLTKSGRRITSLGGISSAPSLSKSSCP